MIWRERMSRIMSSNLSNRVTYSILNIIFKKYEQENLDEETAANLKEVLIETMIKLTGLKPKFIKKKSSQKPPVIKQNDTEKISKKSLVWIDIGQNYETCKEIVFQDSTHPMRDIDKKIVRFAISEEGETRKILKTDEQILKVYKLAYKL